MDQPAEAANPHHPQPPPPSSFPPPFTCSPTLTRAGIKKQAKKHSNSSAHAHAHTAGPRPPRPRLPRPMPIDGYPTATSALQVKTEQALVDVLKISVGRGELGLLGPGNPGAEANGGAGAGAGGNAGNAGGNAGAGGASENGPEAGRGSDAKGPSPSLSSSSSSASGGLGDESYYVPSDEGEGGDDDDDDDGGLSSGESDDADVDGINDGNDNGPLASPASLRRPAEARRFRSEPVLQKHLHMSFLVRNLVQGFPARYMGQDASQPWLMFWTLQAFSVLQVGLDPGNKQRAINTIMEWQHPSGGFGGGPGQLPHLLTSYAAVCALAIVGRAGPGGGWDAVDRTKMYAFFMRLKQRDGSFLVAEDAEVDIRGVYCLLVMATLLDILTPELVAGTAEFIASCQTYEGGFASASQPFYGFGPDGEEVLLASPRPCLGEAHGGYTSCAAASWVLLKPLLDGGYLSPSAPVPPSINVPNLMRWLVQLQGSEIELGGFRGRTNKLVDGCYSWWVGGVFALVEALGARKKEGAGADNDEDDAGGVKTTQKLDGEHDHAKHRYHHQHEAEKDDEWDDVDDSLFDRRALQEYLLLAAQHPAGGLRDKPPKPADSYHTLYCLSGLSIAQHHVYPSDAKRKGLETIWTPREGDDRRRDALRRTVFANALCWREEEGVSVVVGGNANRVNASHPVFNLTMTHSQGIMAYFYGQDSEGVRVCGTVPVGGHAKGK